MSLWASYRERLRHRVLTGHPDVLQIYRLVRYEIDALYATAVGLLSPRQILKRRGVSRRRGLRIHLASGSNPQPGWVNVDASPKADLRTDLRRGLPLPSGSAAMIFCEHFLDHVSYPHLTSRVLRECHRVLAPGGTLRLVLHDAELLARAYVARDVEFFRTIGYPDRPFIEGLNDMFRFQGFHQFIHDHESLERLLRDAGFQQIVRSSHRGSAIPELNLDYEGMDRRVQSMYVEARKP